MYKLINFIEWLICVLRFRTRKSLQRSFKKNLVLLQNHILELEAQDKRTSEQDLVLQICRSVKEHLNKWQIEDPSASLFILDIMVSVARGWVIELITTNERTLILKYYRALECE